MFLCVTPIYIRARVYTEIDLNTQKGTIYSLKRCCWPFFSRRIFVVLFTLFYRLFTRVSGLCKNPELSKHIVLNAHRKKSRLRTNHIAWVCIYAGKKLHIHCTVIHIKITNICDWILLAISTYFICSSFKMIDLFNKFALMICIVREWIRRKRFT